MSIISRNTIAKILFFPALVLVHARFVCASHIWYGEHPEIKLIYNSYARHTPLDAVVAAPPKLTPKYFRKSFPREKPGSKEDHKNLTDEYSRDFKFRFDDLLSVLDVHSTSKTKIRKNCKNLKIVARQIMKDIEAEEGKLLQNGAGNWFYFNLALMCKKINYDGLSYVAANRVSKNYNSALVALEFHQAGLQRQSKRFAKATLKYLELCEAPYIARVSWETAGSDRKTKFIHQILVEIGQLDLAEKAYLICVEAIKRIAFPSTIVRSHQRDPNTGRLIPVEHVRYFGRCQYLFNVYQDLQVIEKRESANLIFDKLIQRILQEGYDEPGWFIYVARKCFELCYLQHSKRAAELTITNEGRIRDLLQHTKQIHSFKFKDLLDTAAQKLTSLFEQRCTTRGLVQMCRTLFEIDMGQCAMRLFYLGLHSSTSQNFPDLFEMASLMHERGETKVVQETLKRMLHLCSPTDGFVSLGEKKGMFGSSPALKMGHLYSVFYDSVDCSLLLSIISQKFGQSALANEAAQHAIDCTLVETYGDPPTEIPVAFEKLRVVFEGLGLTDFMTKVGYYKDKAEKQDPSFRIMSTLQPKLFSVYWVKISETRGAEIKKRRPWVIISSPSHYRRSGSVVKMIPLSTKKRGGIMSLPLQFNEKEQEARLDQGRAVDLSRLDGCLGTLPIQYKVQLSLALENQATLLQ